jgi:amidophosphoribosyltransferase
MCGIVGLFGHPEAAGLATLGLYALQHRGQESAGIVVADGNVLKRKAGMGMVSDTLTAEVAETLPGRAAIGHVRYSTAGESDVANVQPLLMSHHRGPIALSHNGNLVNAAELREQLENEGSIFQTSSDSEVILHLLARSPNPDIVDALTEALRTVRGAYSLLLLVPGRMIAVRDPHGFRPLSIGRKDGAWVVASETCAFDLIGATPVRDLERGEIAVFDVGGRHSFKPFPPVRRAACAFEHVYFARPDSKLFGDSVQQSRKRMGLLLAEEHPVEADMVVPVPDSGVYAAMGFAERSGLPFEMGLVRNHYVGRTFIQPSQHIRNFSVRVKLNPIAELLQGKRIVLVDDSIVRGTTSRKIVRLCREAGAAEVHVRISCPPTRSPCFYGIDTPDREELIASANDTESICRHIGADSLGFLSMEGLCSSLAVEADQVCTACWTMDYPVPLPLSDAAQLRLFDKGRS